MSQLPVNEEKRAGRAAELFSSRWGMLMTALGIAVGTGNIWRFPRVAAANGGGVFILAWTLFLFLWSIPLLVTESALGRASRRGSLGSFMFLRGERGAWMGGFVALITGGIMFYYSVVTGWCLRYLVGTLSGAVNGATGPEFWHAFAGSWQALGYHGAAAVIAGLVVGAGVRLGIEGSAKVMIPVLALIMVYAAVRALCLPGAMAGVHYLFQFKAADFLSPRVYLEALSQSAWSTGAGWGLLLTYSVYSRPKEKIVQNSLIMGLGDNTASLLAALAVIPTVFALLPAEQAAAVVKLPGENSTGLTFIWIPRLLGAGPGGRVMLPLFFLALFFAAMSSFISMIEMWVKNLIDLGLRRRTATLAVTGLTLLGGAPSALSGKFFDNQDWVWGLGLLVSGLLFSLAVRLYGAGRFVREVVNRDDTPDMKPGRWFAFTLSWLIPLQFAVLLLWWFWLSLGWDRANWWNPLGVATIGSCLAQWGLGVVLLLTAGSWLARRVKANDLRESSFKD